MYMYVYLVCCGRMAFVFAVVINGQLVGGSLGRSYLTNMPQVSHW